MARFHYEAVAASGEVVSGEMDAPSEGAVIERLQALGHVPIRASAGHGARLLHFLSQPLFARGKGKPAELVLLTEQLGMLLHAGLPLDRALEIAQTLVDGARARECLAAVLDRVRGGNSLADAMAAEGNRFPPFYLGIVRAGEAGGSLDGALLQLAEFLQRSQAARDQVKSAMIYPLVVLMAGCLSVGGLFAFVIPRLRPILDQAGASLPAMTRAMLAISDAVRDDWWAICALVAIVILLAREAMQRPSMRRRWDRRILDLPLIGALIVKIDMARFGRTLGTLLRNGIAPLAALATTAEALNNTSLRDVVATLAETLKEGNALADLLAQSKLIPPLVVHLVRVGEETGRLDEMLLKVADIYDRETRRSIDRLLALMVPGVTIGLGAIVAVVIGSVLTAILGVYDLAL
jgi:general secretion pathway protein F